MYIVYTEARSILMEEDGQARGVLAQLAARDASRQQQIERARESRMDEADPKESVAAFWSSFKSQLEGARTAGAFHRHANQPGASLASCEGGFSLLFRGPE